MKKIALYIPDLRFGGAERMLVNLANEFASKGYNVDLVLNARKGDYLDLVSNKVNIIDLSVKRAMYAIVPLSIYLIRNRPDRILSSLYHANLVAILSSLITGNSKKLYIRQENVLDEISKGDNFRSKLHLLLVKTFYRFSAGIIAISEGVRENFIFNKVVSGQDIATIHNPAFNEDILRQKNEPLQCDFIDKGDRVFVNVGRLNIAKNHRLLIDVFGKLVESRDETIKLIIVGDGELRSELEQQVMNLGLTERVFFTGAQTNPYKWLAFAELFVFSSKWEGFGNVVVEALACTGKVISTDCPSGPFEILQGGKYGYLVKNDSFDELYSILTLYLENKLEFNVPEEAYKRFSVKSVASNYLDYFGL